MLKPTVVLPLLCASLGAQVSFVDVVEQTGTDSVSYGRAAAMVDFDDDGLLDLFAGNALDPSVAFRQNPDHTFDDVTAEWGLPTDDDKATFCVLATDFDGDADEDLFLVNGGFVFDEANGLFRNDLDATGTFADVTAAAGDVGVPGNSFGATVLDYDNDGDLDVFISRNGQGCDLLRNDGGLVFTNVDQEAEVAAGQGPGQELSHVGAGDIDNDGWWDVGVGNRQGRNLLYRNDGDGTFTDIASSAGVDSAFDNFGLVFDDFDNDGWLDIMIAKYQPNEITTTTRILLNDGDLTFTDVSDGTTLTGQTDMGHNVGDLDADGHPDIYIGTGHPDFASLDVMFLVRPDGAGGIETVDVSASSGILVNGETRCHGMAFGDYDEDGDVDVYVNNGGPQKLPATAEENFFWQNQGNGNGWFKLGLTGVVSPAAPVGARAKVTTTTGREVWRHLAVGKGFGNTNAPVLFFGLDDEFALDRLDVLWPSGIEQVAFDPPALDRLDLVETGLRLVGEPALGGAVTLQVVGTAGHRADLFLAAATTEAPLPKYGGVLYLQPPLVPLLAVTIGASGLVEIPLTIPDMPVLSGLSIPVQGWIRPEGANSGGVLSNLVLIEIP